ncbi:MAG: hypothetical protein GW892_32380 [Armatimonadetes bacterium]|nr:hypothetical protein [Armatimonadota bacterium]NCO91661.1 hypothetical protein [Armatimonadota bacterium]NCP30475.1 hypothetical protein [Armatimonadota bacterium]
MSRTCLRPMPRPALAGLLSGLAVVAPGCARKAEPPQPATPPAVPGAQQQPQGQGVPPGRTANFSGNWTCVYGNDTIPGALQQNGSQLTGYCLYPGNNRATFSGTVTGNTLSGTLDVPHQKARRSIVATLNGNSMEGTWDGNSKWSATRR